jgi:plastocyanin
MSANSIFGRGSVLQRGDGASTEVFTPIPSLTVVAGPKITSGRQETTSHQTTGQLKEYLPTSVEITYGMQINFLPTDTTHQGLRADALANRLVNFKLKNVGETTGTTFAAYITNYEEDKPVDKQMTAKFDLLISGTFTAPA